MKKLSYILLCAALLLTFPACREGNKKPKNYNGMTLVDKQALDFIKEGLEGGRTEIRAAAIALKNSTNARVIALAEHMTDDHTLAVTELKKIAADKNVMTGNIISPEHKKMMAELEGKLGVEFDRAFIDMVIPHHQEQISLYKSVEHNTSAKIQAFAKKTLPVLQKHLDAAKEISASLR